MSRLLPSWESTKLLGRSPQLTKETRATSLSVGLGGLPKPLRGSFAILAKCLNEIPMARGDVQASLPSGRAATAGTNDCSMVIGRSLGWLTGFPSTSRRWYHLPCTQAHLLRPNETEFASPAQLRFRQVGSGGVRFRCRSKTSGLQFEQYEPQDRVWSSIGENVPSTSTRARLTRTSASCIRLYVTRTRHRRICRSTRAYE